MEPADFKSIIVKRARYPAFAFPVFYVAKGLCSEKFEKELGHRLSFAGVLLKNNKRIALFGEKEDIALLVESALKKFVGSREYIKNKNLQFNKEKIKLLSFIRKEMLPSKIKKASNKELYCLLEGYYNKYRDFNMTAAGFLYFFTNPLGKLIKERIKKEHLFLLEAPYLSYATRFDLDYIKECKKITKKLSKRWGWIPFDYIGPDDWGEEYFLGRMGVNGKTKEIIENNTKLREKQRKTLKSYDETTRRLIQDFHLISKMQDDRKGIATLTHVYFQKYLINEISKRTGIKQEHLRAMIPEEIKEALLDDKMFDVELLEKRLYQGLILFYKERFTVHVGDDIYKKFIELLPKIHELKGRVACKGKVQGVVKLVLTSKDIPKVKEGDIIVAPMTTPNYIPAMKKAAGFITDEGGITCHAAIISREMNKPCIIGTQSATDILKDGNIVELDADKGEVRVIE